MLVGQRFKRYDARRCELKGGVRVPGDARELHADAGRLAYRTRHTIVLVDLATGARRTVAATSPRWDIAGIALDGKRLTWAESTLTAERKYTTRIRTLVLY